MPHDNLDQMLYNWSNGADHSVVLTHKEFFPINTFDIIIIRAYFLHWFANTVTGGVTCDQPGLPVYVFDHGSDS